MLSEQEIAYKLGELTGFLYRPEVRALCLSQGVNTELEGAIEDLKAISHALYYSEPLNKEP